MYKTYDFKTKGLLDSIIQDFPNVNIEQVSEIYLLEKHIQQGTNTQLYAFSAIYFGNKIIIPKIGTQKFVINVKYEKQTKKYLANVKDILISHANNIDDTFILGLKNIDEKSLRLNINLLAPYDFPEHYSKEHIISAISLGELSLPKK